MTFSCVCAIKRFVIPKTVWRKQYIKLFAVFATVDQICINVEKGGDFLNTIENGKLRLTADEAEFIKDLIIRNESVIRAVVRSELHEDFDLLGEDCVAEIYLLACKKVAVLKNHENPEGWLSVASRRVAQNVKRKNATISEHYIDTEVTDIAGKNDIFEEALYNVWIENGSIDKLLGVLTPREREIYELVYKKRIKSNEAANILGVSDSTVRNTAASIRRKIKDAAKDMLY